MLSSEGTQELVEASISKEHQSAILKSAHLNYRRKKNIPLSTPQRSQKQNSEAAHTEAKVAAQHTCILTFATALSERYPAAMLPTRPPISKALM